MNKAITIASVFLFWLACAATARAQAPANAIEGFEVTEQGGKTLVRITTKEPLRSAPPNFAVTTPARIAFDFANTTNALGRSSQDISQGELRSMNVVQGAERTRLVLNLRRAVPHETTVDGRSVIITLSEAPVAQNPPGGPGSRFAQGRADAKHQIHDDDFRRGKGGEGRVGDDLSDTTTGIDIRTQGQNIVVDFLKTGLPENLRRRLDVVDFATPVNTINTFQQGENVRMIIEPRGQWEHNAYQSDTQFVLEVKPVNPDASRATQRGRYTGEKLSLNFQNVEVQGDVAADGVARDDVQVGEVGDDVQHRPHLDVLEVQRQLLAGVAAALGRARGVRVHGLHLEHELRVRLVGVVLPLAARLDDHAHVLALLERVDGVHRRGEVDHVEAPAQVLRQPGLQEVDHDVLPLRADVDAGGRVGEVVTDAALPALAAAEVVVVDLVLGVGPALGEARPRASGGVLRHRRLRQGDDHAAAVDGRLVRHGAPQVKHQARALRALHHVHAAQLALRNVLAGAAERVGGVGEIECDARRVGHREVRRRAAQRLLGGDPDDGLAALLRDLEAFDGVGRSLRPRRCRAGQPEEKHRSDGDRLVHLFVSTNCSALLRSTHSPPPSWISSLRAIWPSSIPVTTPKFWPM